MVSSLINVVLAGSSDPAIVDDSTVLLMLLLLVLDSFSVTSVEPLLTAIPVENIPPISVTALVQIERLSIYVNRC